MNVREVATYSEDNEETLKGDRGERNEETGKACVGMEDDGHSGRRAWRMVATARSSCEWCLSQPRGVKAAVVETNGDDCSTLIATTPREQLWGEQNERWARPRKTADLYKWAYWASPALARLGTTRLMHDSTGPAKQTGHTVPANMPKARPTTQAVTDRAKLGQSGHCCGTVDPTARRARCSGGTGQQRGVGAVLHDSRVATRGRGGRQPGGDAARRGRAARSGDKVRATRPDKAGQRDWARRGPGEAGWWRESGVGRRVPAIGGIRCPF